MAKRLGIFICLVSLFLVVLFAVGCSTKKGEDGLVTLRFVTWGGLPQEKAVREKLVKMFNSSHPGSLVKLDCYPGHYYTVLLTQIAGGSAPDVFLADGHIIPEFAEKGAIVSLEPYLKKEGEDFIKAHYPVVVDKFRFKGNIYAFPCEFSPIVLFYNKDIFDEMNVSYPDERWDWGKFISNAQKLTKRDSFGKIVNYGVYPLGGVEVFIPQNNGVVINEEGQPIFDTPETIEAIRFYFDLIKKYRVAPDTIRDEIEPYAGFRMGKSAMIFAGRWLVPDLRAGSQFRWGVAPLPKGRARATTICVHGFYITTQSKHKEEAWEFIKFMVGETGQRENAKLGNLVPSLKEVVESDVFLYDKEHPEEGNNVYIDSLSYVGYEPWPLYPKVPARLSRDIIERELAKVQVGQQSAEETVKRIDEEINKAIVAGEE